MESGAANHSDPARAPAGRVPDFFVVGHAKSGTTALYAMLGQHPEIFLGQKEPRFFAEELRVRDIPRLGGTPQTLSDYKAWFADARPDQLVGDISPDYLWSHRAAELIAEVQPQAQIIAILREPASFLYSLHRQWLRHYVEVESDFRRALELEPSRLQGLNMPRDTYWPKALFYSDHVRYVEQLRRYEERFGRERMLVLIYEDYRRDNDATVRTVLRFLGVDEHAAIAERDSNPSVHIQSPRLHSLLRRLLVADAPAFAATKSFVKALTPMRVRQGALQTVRKRVVYGEPEPPDEAFMRELRRRFKPEVVALSEYLDRDFVGLWGYDEAG